MKRLGEFTTENFTYSRLGSFHKNKHYCLTYKIHAKMKKSEIKNNLKGMLNWNYIYYNVVNKEGHVIESFDTEQMARIYIRRSSNITLFIQKCHNISSIL